MMRKQVRFGAAILALVFVLVGVSGAFALDVTVDIPTNPTAASLLQGALNTEFNDIDANPSDLIKAFATSSVYASQGAAQRGYGEPKLFAVTLGSMVGLKVGAKPSGIGDYFANIADTIKNDGDVTLGVNVQAISGQFMLNTSRWLLNGLDLGVRFGAFGLHSIENFGFTTLSFGVVGNYQLIKEKNLVPILVKWRGVSLGSGVIYQNTKMNYAMDLDTVNATDGSLIDVSIDPKLEFDMKINTVTIPLEATTAVQLFSFLNVTLGLGADLAFGNNKLNLGVSGDITDTTLGPIGGTVSVNGGGKEAPQFFNFKLMTGVGFKIGPVILDVPIVWYPGKDTGVGVGVTLGATF
ncbi:hypothetical protein FACS189468_0030 [Spirochaetia bacterium]|nr:hypothetical protein FACS189468_0030 [Spirochaetia bacterium]